MSSVLKPPDCTTGLKKHGVENPVSSRNGRGARLDNDKHKAETLQDVVSRIHERAQTEPDGDAFLWFKRELIETWTWARLSEEISQFARQYHLRGLVTGDRLLLGGPNCPRWIAACMAAIELGIIVVPFDIQLDSESLASIVNDAAPSLLVTSRDGYQRITTLVPGFTLDALIFDEQIFEQDDAMDPDEPRFRPAGDALHDCDHTVHARDIAAIFYTSGTTGLPKGVPLSHANLVYQLKALGESGVILDTDRILLPLPFYHIYPFGLAIMYPMAHGLPIIMPSDLTGPQLLRAIKEGNATVLVGVPRLYRAFAAAIDSKTKNLPPLQATAFKTLLQISKKVRECGGPYLGKRFFKRLHDEIGPRLRVFTSGGAPLDPAVAWKLESLGWPIAIGYGLTETSPLISLKAPGDPNLDTVGKCLPGTEFSIAANNAGSLDAEPTHNALPGYNRGQHANKSHFRSQDKKQSQNNGNTVGEILVRGPGVFSGYRNLPDKTSDVLDSAGWFRTGDLGCMVNGRLKILGRFTSLIVTESGKKIDPEYLEEHYAKHPLIKEIGILSKPGKLVAVVVPHIEAMQNAGSDGARLMHDAIDERSIGLPTYKRLSGYVVSNEPLNRTPMDKVQRHKLVERYDQIRKGVSKRNASADAGEVSTEDLLILENPMARSVIDILGTKYTKETISLDTSPQLDLGIDSLDWLSLTLEITDVTGVRLDEDAVARVKTVRDLLNEVINARCSDSAVKTLSFDSPESALKPGEIEWLNPPTRLQSLTFSFLYSLIYLFMHLYFRIKIEGREHLPTNQPCIFVANHASFIDAFVLGYALPFKRLQNTAWAAWTGIAFANGLFRFLSRISQAIPIDAEHSPMTSIALAAGAIKRGKNLVWFPEARRSLTGELLPFKPGIGFLLEHFSLPVIPVYLRNTDKALPAGSFWPRPVTMTVTFGEPVTSSTLLEEAPGNTIPERISTALRARILALKIAPRILP